VSIESILRRKGTDVTTIAPEASIKKAVDWLRAKNIGALVVTSGNAVLGLISEREIVQAFSRYGEAAASMPVKETMQYGVTTVSPDESVNRDPDDAPSRAPHAGTTRRQPSRDRQHRRCSQVSTGGAGA
jgi:CBS domain-containing protein